MGKGEKTNEIGKKNDFGTKKFKSRKIQCGRN